MYSRILCATDFSGTSYEAVKAADRMARAFGAELVLMHVVVPFIPLLEAETLPPFNLAEYERAWVEGADKKLREVAGRLVDKAVRVTPVVRTGQPAQSIDQYAEENGVDLIVIATHGMTGWRHYLLGSVAQKVIQHTSRPVLVVRGEVAPQPSIGQ